MSKKNILILIAVFFAAAVAAGYYFLWLPQVNKSQPVAALPDKLFGWKYPAANFPIAQSTTGTGQNLFDFQIAFSSIRDPGGIPQGLPVRLQIPIIGVDSAIEDALITPDGRMDVPQGSVNVAWFALGPHPGQVGSAVIGGHFGINKGVKFVFYDLDKLKVGDKVYIYDDKNNTLAFQVRSIKLFDRNADATPVFTSTDGLAHLNLITCEGIWNQVNGTYPSRRVVFTDAIAPEGAVTVQPVLPLTGLPVTITKPKPIPPKPIPTPTPIPATTTATTTIPSTTSIIISSSTPVQITTSSPVITPAAVPSILPSSAPSVFTQAVKSSYETPIDGVVTSSLLLAIAFLAFKIFRP